MTGKSIVDHFQANDFALIRNSPPDSYVHFLTLCTVVRFLKMYQSPNPPPPGVWMISTSPGST